MARDPHRIRPLLAELEAVWAKHPDLRLGQLIGNATTAPYYIEDEDLIAAIKYCYRPGSPSATP